MKRSPIRRIAPPAYSVVIVAILALMLGAFVVNAQDIPILLDENKTGSLTPEATVASFAFNSTAPISIRARTFAITVGFAPALRILDPSGIVIQIAPNSEQETAVEIPFTAIGVGVYRVEVFSANGVLGDFLLNIESGEPAAPPTPLTPGQIVNGTVSPQQGRQAFTFPGSDVGGLLLILQSDLPVSGPVVTLRDADSGDTLALSSARMKGVRYHIPIGVTNYLLEVTYGGASIPETYQLCLAPEANVGACPIGIQGGGAVAPPAATEEVVPTLAPTFLPPLPPSNVCILGSATGGNVNVRSGPSQSFSVIAQLTGISTAVVLGRLPDSSWYHINVNGLIGWISATVVRFGGPCQNVPFITPTPTATLAATATTTATGTPPTATPTATATATATATTGAVPTLNYSLPAVYGSTALTSGFVPDPFTVGVTAGGPASASYLGGGCYGYTTSAPTFSVNYTSGAFTLLRFYFFGGGDTTMIINSPSGSYFCVDDSFGTLNPTIDFNSPSSGRYDVWVASYAQGASIGGTLYVTENSGNHP